MGQCQLYRDTAGMSVQQELTGEDLSRGDVVELWLDMDVGGDYDSSTINADDFQIVLSAGDFTTRRAEAHIFYPEPADTERNRFVRVRAAPLPNGYTLEASIAWELLSVTPSADLIIGYAIVLSDIDDRTLSDVQSQLTTTPKSPFRNPRTFGNLRLLIEND